VAAMKQSLRAHALTICRPASVSKLCQRIAEADAAVVAVAGAPPIHEIAQRLAAHASDRAASNRQAAGLENPGAAVPVGLLCVGPEGDWTEAELEQLVAAGAIPVGLGPLRLRAETAAIALLSFVRLHLL
jgi:16S rRNA (uracil1498-N3)-methyltransferase